ncbi:acetyltransferase [Noviherbaspirillum saxi]|uniref:Acetyltransferase n=1 Tax=Noviherbaspirillum saxi TaxID=2320863 RepID=A0A3A3FTV9_9BURK|nr:acetyltransferase [Noviherbaspirillum saxi]RJF99486.1 acetyltransferase [Noviherbaspirillum saxi]
MHELISTKASGDDRPVIIFGNLRSASLAWYCLLHDSPWQVAGFTVDEAYLASSHFEGLPLVPFETLEARYPPTDFRLLIPMGYQRINGVRRTRFEMARQRGYTFVSYVSSRASVWPDLKIGENVLIYEHAIIQPFARIGDNCIIRSGAHISHHCEVADHAFVAAEVAMGGEGYVGEQAFVGVGAVLRDRIRVAERSFIGAGAVVVQDTQPDGVYVGNPARKAGKTALEASGG